MFRFFWRRRKIKKSLKRLLLFYSHYRTLSPISVGSRYVNSVYYLVNTFSLPKRQHYFNFLNLKLLKNYNISAGVFLKEAGYDIKFYKRHYLSAATLILHLRQHYSAWFKGVYILIIKNFNYRQVLFFRKMLTLMKVDIYYMINTKSYMPRFFPKRRIKRRVLRILGHQ